MNSQPTVNASTGQTDEDAEFRRRPLRIGRIAIAAVIIVIGLLNREQLEENECVSAWTSTDNHLLSHGAPLETQQGLSSLKLLVMSPYL
jgi:hypothetical protein